MIRNLKVLGIAVVAVFAMSATMASMAQATPNWWFTTDAAAGKKTTLTAEQLGEDIFSTTAGVVKCNAHYTGSVVGPTQSSVTLHPVYSGCTAFGFAATVDTTGCSFIFDTSTTKFLATTTVECEAGKEITVVAKLAGVTKCTVHIGAQDVGLVTLTNATKENGIKYIHADISLSAITYKHTAGTGAGACTSGSASNGSYTGTAAVTGFNEGGGETSIDLG
jgi:hypothetical protein